MTTPYDESTPTMDLAKIKAMLFGEASSGALPGDWSGSQTQQYHIFERLNLFGSSFDLFDPYWSEIITAQEFIAASDYYDLERGVAHALRTGRASYAKVIKDGLLRRLLAYLQNYEPVDIEGTSTNKGSLDTAEPIVVGELHCPHIKGATATFENAIERSEKLGLEVTAAGLGGGGWTRERLHASTTTFSITSAECKLICARLRGDYMIWEHQDTKKRMVLTNVTGIHKLFLASLKVDAAYQEAHLCEDPDNFDRCYKELDSGVSNKKDLMDDFPLRLAPGIEESYEDKEEWTTAREYTGSWGSEIKLGDAALSASVTYTSRFLRKVKVTVKLPYGFHYISRYRSARELPQQWTAKPYP
jgi:hypothetical protein